MAALSRTHFADTLKLALSACWIALVALMSQHLASERQQLGPSSELPEQARSIREQVPTFYDGLDGPSNPRLVATAVFQSLDRTSLDEIRGRDGVLEIAAGSTPEALRAAEFVDTVVKSVGIDHAGLSSEIYEQAGFEITLEPLRRGYKQGDLLKLLGGNAQRVMATPR